MIDDSESNEAIDEARTFLATNLKGLMADAVEWMEERNRELRAGTRYGNATPAEARLFSALRGSERSLSELARAIGVSRQAVHRTAHRLADHGVVRIVAPSGEGTDKRERVVQITARGRRVQEMAAKNLRQIEAEIASTIGIDKLEQLKQLLIELLETRRNDQTSL